MGVHCPQDGGFIGAAGCTHPRHAHSPLVKRLLKAKTPELIEEHHARAALKEGFYVNTQSGERMGFGETLLSHLTSAHHPNDAKNRLERLAYAIDTVRRPDGVEINHREIKGRTAYAKAYENFGMLVLADKKGVIRQVFNFFPNRKGRKK